MKFRKLAAIVASAALVGCMAFAGGCSSSDDSSSDETSTEETTTEETSSEETTYSSEGLELLEDGVLTIATSPDFPPFENLEDGEYVGMEIEMMEEVASRLGLEAEFTTIQFDGIIPAIVAGGQADCAVSGITINPEREEEVDFTISYYTDDLSVIVMQDSDFTEDNIDDTLNAEGMTIAVQTGTTAETYAQEYFPNATVTGYGSANDTFAALASGQADSVITNMAVGESMVNGSYTDAWIVENIATGEEYGVAVSKDNPELTEQLNAVLQEMLDDGTIDALIEEYMS